MIESRGSSAVNNVIGLDSTKERQSLKSGRQLLIAIFSHIEVYPPSLNALFHLAPLFDEVTVVVRNVWISDWKYPSNVKLVTSGSFVPLEDVGKNSLRQKLGAYLSFGRNLRKVAKRVKPDIVLLYDAAAFSLFNLFVPVERKAKRPLIWYHNHDVSVAEEVGRLSLMRLMKMLELRYFRHAEIFSLPNEVRLKYFPISELSAPPYIIPNYPSNLFFGKWKRQSDIGSGNIRLIFQGHISPSNRIEAFIELLTQPIGERNLELHLAGPISYSYRTTLLNFAQSLSVQDRLFLYGRIPYTRLPELTSSCHIGLAIYGFHNTMVRTMSTASNKIFEYASVGLPVLINDRPDLKEEFSRYPWIQFIDEHSDNLRSVVQNVVSGYVAFSMAARRDFEQTLNFESAFQIVKVRLERELAGV